MIRYIALPVLLQVLLIIHVFKTGRDRFWIYILFFIPFAGGIAYLVVEVIPSFLSSGKLDSVGESADRMFNPGGRLRRQEDRASMSPTFRNVCDLGDMYLDQGRYEEAATMYHQALVPPFDTNDEYTYKLAFARYKSEDFSSADQCMRKLSELNVKKLKPRESILWALIKEEAGDLDGAEAMYHEVRKQSGSLSYQVDYARFLRRTGRTDEARNEYQIIIGTFERLPPNYKKQYRNLMPEVRQEYQNLNAG